MTDNDEKILTLAFRAALAERKETFLALYPRKLKLVVVGIPLLVLVSFGVAGILSEETIPEEPAPPPALVSESLPQQPPVEDHHPGAADKEAPPAPKAASREAHHEATASNDDYDSKAGMLSAPDPSLLEKTPSGDLPVISRDGRKPWEVYARPFDHLDSRPRIALVITDLGLSRVATDAAIRRLPGPVTLAFDVYGQAIKDWLVRARQDGHETLLTLPMEPLDYPREDPGPGTLLVGLSNTDNIARLSNFLTSGSGYIGITSLSGGRFLAEPGKLGPVLESLNARGLVILSAEPSRHNLVADMAKKKSVPFASATAILDDPPSPERIAAELEHIERVARLRGSAIAIASPLPLTLDMLEPWLQGLKERGFALAPLSAVIVNPGEP